MRGVVIRDGTEPGGTGGLEFDLAEVLSALGPRVGESRWSSRNLSYVSIDETNIDTLDAAAAGGSVAGNDLVKTLPQLLQVIDGELQGFSQDSAPWVVIRAVDSSWWEVLSDDPSSLQAIRNRFRVVHDLPA
jgi:hypothetical protein